MLQVPHEKLFLRRLLCFLFSVKDDACVSYYILPDPRDVLSIQYKNSSICSVPLNDPT